MNGTLNENSNDPKKMWNIISEKIGKKQKKSANKIKCIHEKGIKIENKTEMANIMNNFYCNVGKNLSKQIQQPNEKPNEIASNL